MDCEHNYIKLTNIEKDNIWLLLIFTYTKREQLICLKCGVKIR